MLKNKNGITLIALIVTIVIMLILASVTIKIAKDGGLFDYAKKAKKETENAINYEQELINEMYNLVDGNAQESLLAVHNWTRTGDTFTCSHCSKTYEMGQIVNYTAKGEKISTTILATKSGLDKYYSANSNSYPTDANVDENGNQIIKAQNTNWVVLGIEDTNKDGKYETLLITSEREVLPVANKPLYFYGAAGYNNAPNELKRICRELYSNSEYGVARNMTIEDVNSCLNNPLQAMALGGMYNDGSWKTTGNLTTKLKDVPEVYSLLVTNGTYTTDGINTEEALGNYVLNGYNYTLNGDGVSVASRVDSSKTSPVTEAEKNTIFGSSKNYAYWLASRGVSAGSDSAYIGPGYVNRGDVRSCRDFFRSDGGENEGRAGLRPIVSLKSKLPEY